MNTVYIRTAIFSKKPSSEIIQKLQYTQTRENMQWIVFLEGLIVTSYIYIEYICGGKKMYFWE